MWWPFPGGPEGKASAGKAGDPGSIPGSGRYPGEGNGNSPPHSCLENPMDRGGWCAEVRGVAKSRTRLSDFTFTDHVTFSNGPITRGRTRSSKQRGACWVVILVTCQAEAYVLMFPLSRYSRKDGLGRDLERSEGEVWDKP